MQIDDNILITYGAVAYRVNKGEFIFHEGTTPIFYYQVVEGCIKVFTSNTKGKEFIQGIFSNGQSFGEPPFMLAISVFEALRDAVAQAKQEDQTVQLKAPATAENVLMALG